MSARNIRLWVLRERCGESGNFNRRNSELVSWWVSDSKTEENNVGVRPFAVIVMSMMAIRGREYNSELMCLECVGIAGKGAYYLDIPLWRKRSYYTDSDVRFPQYLSFAGWAKNQ